MQKVAKNRLTPLEISEIPRHSEIVIFDRMKIASIWDNTLQTSGSNLH